MSSISRTPSLTPSKSPSPEPPVQPDHFYRTDDSPAHSPSSDGKTNGKSWLDPADDPLALRGIPVFKPTMEEFQNFEAYMNRVECWGSRSGIVKVIPPREWCVTCYSFHCPISSRFSVRTESLPPLKEQLANVKIKTPIEQHMFGSGGLFRQENMEKRKIMSVREWVELCATDDFRAPGVSEVGLHARSANAKPKTRRSRKTSVAVKAGSADPDADMAIMVKEEPVDDVMVVVPDDALGSDQISIPVQGLTLPKEDDLATTPGNARKVTGKRQAASKHSKEAEKLARDAAFLETFDPHSAWLPPGTTAEDYTPEFCQKLERKYWRNCGLAKPAWYGADTQG